MSENEMLKAGFSCMCIPFRVAHRGGGQYLLMEKSEGLSISDSSSHKSFFSSQNQKACVAF